jgi:hypothetical protein
MMAREDINTYVRVHGGSARARFDDGNRCKMTGLRDSRGDVSEARD